MTKDLDQASIRRTVLATADAHRLYAQHGITALGDPDWWTIRA